MVVVEGVVVVVVVVVVVEVVVGAAVVVVGAEDDMEMMPVAVELGSWVGAPYATPLNMAAISLSRVDALRRGRRGRSPSFPRTLVEVSMLALGLRGDKADETRLNCPLTPDTRQQDTVSMAAQQNRERVCGNEDILSGKGEGVNTR